jgi:hypothetical protein
MLIFVFGSTGVGTGALRASTLPAPQLNISYNTIISFLAV